MIDRLRQLPTTFQTSVRERRYTPLLVPKEFSARAENYAQVDFLRSSEVQVDRVRSDCERGIYAQIDFVERLFVESSKAQIEFGVRHAILSVISEDPGELRQFDGFRLQGVDRAGYVSVQDYPTAVSVAMYALPGRALAELALPAQATAITIGHKSQWQVPKLH